MLHSFVFDGDAKTPIKYSNKMLQSEHLAAHEKAGKIAVREFVAAPKGGMLERVAATKEYMLEPFDNANVCVANCGGKCVALTEAPFPVEFDPRTADTIGPVKYDTVLETGLLTTAHPITAPSGESYNIMSCLGWGLKEDCYQVFRVRPDGASEGSIERELVCKVPASEGNAAYMHSFALSENHVVLMEFPLRFSLPQVVVDETRLILQGREHTATSMFTWQPHRGTTFIVINVNEKREVGRFRTPEALFTYHPVNCVEDDAGNLHLDITKYETEVVYPIYFLEELRAASEMEWAFESDVSRYSLRLDASPEERASGSAVRSAVLVDQLCEFPRINNRFRGNPNYRFCYGTGPPSLDQRFWRPLVKCDLRAGEVKLWEEAGTAPGEAIFVENPRGAAEDDGVLLSVCLDGAAERSFVLGLDAASLSEVFRAYLPHHVPAGFHGEWFAA